MASRRHDDVAPPTAWDFFIGALQAVVPDFEGLSDEPLRLEFQASDPAVIEVRSGRELWDWCLERDPIARRLVANLTEEQRETIRQVLNGMVRERSGGNGPAVLTVPLNIGIGTNCAR